MIHTAYRLSLRRFQERAFTGEGARRAGGRWNPGGFPVVYLSSTLSLAVLEFLVHFATFADAPELLAFRVEFDSRLMSAANLPADWQYLALTETREVGREWLRNGTTPVLEVPSFVVPTEKNLVVNPIHSKFSRLEIGSAEPFVLDPGLHRRFA